MIGILLSITLTLVLNGIQENLQRDVVKVEVSNFQEEGFECVAANDDFSFQALDSCVGNTLLIVSSPSVRGMNFPRNLRFTSNYEMVSSRNVFVQERVVRDQYAYNYFMGASYRYFVYTLERILI